MDIEEQIQAEVESSAAMSAPSEATEEVVSDDDLEQQEVEQASQEELYDLPDGRKVTAKALSDEYHKLLPEFTRRSQELAKFKEIKREPEPAAKTEPEPWEQPDWQPKTWQEVFEAGKRATLKEVSPMLSEFEQAKQQRELTAQATQATEAEMARIKEKDPRVNEDAVFQYANKYGTSLTAAYQVMQDIKNLEKTVEQRVLKNLKTRDADGIGVSSATSVEDDTPTYQEINSQRSIGSAARAALARYKGK